MNFLLKLSKDLKELHDIEDNMERLKEKRIKESLDDLGLSVDEYDEIKSYVLSKQKEKEYAEKMKELKKEKEDKEKDLYADITKSVDYMTYNSKTGKYSLKLADCSITYNPKFPYYVSFQDEEEKENAIQKIIDSGWLDCLEINEEKYLEKMNEKTRLPGIRKRDNFVKSEFSVRRN